MTNSLRGSVWRKWDLHVHTPLSIEQNYGGEQGWEEYLNALESLHPDIKVLGINDYLFIDGYTRLLKEKIENGRLQNIEILFPVVELRIDKFGNLGQTDPFKRVNFHVIFSPELSPNLIQEQFLNSLSSIYKVDITDEASSYWNGVLTRQSIIDLGQKLIDSSGGKITDGPLKAGFNSLNVNYEQLLTRLDNSYITGKYLTAVGKTEWDALRWDGSVADKKNIINRANIIFSASPSVETALNGKQKLLEQNVNSNLLHCSDAHGYPQDTQTKPNDLGHCFTWIKADPTFEGLKQIIFEPNQRVRIQLEEPDYKEDKLVIDEVKFVTNDNKFTSKPILLNKNLNVIIGGKSSGKSILLHCIAKTLLSDRSILKSNGAYRYDFGENFDFIVKMNSGLTQSINRLDEEPSVLSEIKYIPQNYLSKLAEPETKKGNELLKLVRGLLLEDPDYNTKYNTFLEAVKSNDRRRELLINNYFEIKQKISTLQQEIISKGNEEALVASIAANEQKVTLLKQQIGLTPEQIQHYNHYNVELQKISIEVSSVRNDYSKVVSFNNDARSVMQELVNKKNLLLSSIETEDVKGYFAERYKILDDVYKSIINIDSVVALNPERRFIDANSVFNLAFQAKAKRKQELEALLAPFVQNEEIKKQIELIEKSITEDKQKQSAINQIKSEIVKNVAALADEKSKIFILYQDNYQQYIDIISEIEQRALSLKGDNLEIKGMPKFNYPKFSKAMLSLSDGRRINSNSYTIYNENLTAVSECKIEDILPSIRSIFDEIDSGRYHLNSKSDIKYAIKVLLDDYYFDYWNVIYDSDTLDQMSTGKASFVILMLIVGLSISKAPILIDQPEDNLDNRSITKDLVTYLKNKKLERQIIIVTHNPNVVVNADAENIIVANQRGQNDVRSNSPYVFDYINGALENTMAQDNQQEDILLSMGIREHIAEIVEGGKEAFKSREKKYGFSNARV